MQEIQLFNYKVLTPDISLTNRKKVWWLADRLMKNDDHYVLEIDLQDVDSYPEDFTYSIGNLLLWETAINSEALSMRCCI